jgi:hypothetical protein
MPSRSNTLRELIIIVPPFVGWKLRIGKIAEQEQSGECPEGHNGLLAY